NLRPGTLWNVGPRIVELAGQTPATAMNDRTPRGVVERVQGDLDAFRAEHKLDTVIVINLASTEQVPPPDQWPTTWAAAEALLDRAEGPLPASSLCAIAALDRGLPYINFTPSLGATPAGLDELARLRGTCHAGRDGKTGETLLKSVLAPMFAARNLQVMS